MSELKQLRAAMDKLDVDVDVDLVVSDKAISHAAAANRGRRARIWISRAAIVASGEVLLGTLAHEIAHVLDPHDRKDRALSRIGFCTLAAPAAFALVIYPSIAEAQGAPRSFVFAAWFAGWIPFLAAIAWSSRISHRRELRADRTAAQLLGNAEPVLAMIDRNAAVEATYGPVDRLNARRTHPAPARRRRALLAEPIA